MEYQKISVEKEKKAELDKLVQEKIDPAIRIFANQNELKAAFKSPGMIFSHS